MRPPKAVKGEMRTLAASRRWEHGRCPQSGAAPARGTSTGPTRPAASSRWQGPPPELPSRVRGHPRRPAPRPPEVVSVLRQPATIVTVFQDPVKGLADALADPPDLILLDMRMPGMSGEEVFARLHEVHPGLPIVFLTAVGSVESAVLAMT